MSIFPLLTPMLLHADPRWSESFQSSTSTKTDGGGSSTAPTSSTDSKKDGGTGDINDHDDDKIVTWPKDKKVDSSGSEIYGLHPHVYAEPTEGPEVGAVTNLGYAKTLVVDMSPCKAVFGTSGEGGKPTMGLQLFSMNATEGKTIFEDILQQLDLFDGKMPSLPLRFAVLNDVSIAESWSSTYRDTSFEGLANVGSDRIQELKAITGAGKSSEIAGRMGGPQEITDLLKGIESSFQGMANKVGGAGAGTAVQALLEGSKVDFPTIWQGSNYDPQYQFTVRLYNSWPTDPEAYKKYILRPLAILLAMSVPVSDSKYTFSFPLLVRARCAGLFKINAGFISSIQVIKGGDTNDITWQQQPGMIDVRVTVDSLYQTMIGTTKAGADAESDADRPTLKKYIDNLRDWVDYKLPSPDNADNTVPPAVDSIAVDTSTLNITLPEIPIPRVPDVLSSLMNTLNGTLDALGNVFGIAGDLLASVSEIMSTFTSNIDSCFNFVNSLMVNVTSSLMCLDFNLPTPLINLSRRPGFVRPPNSAVSLLTSIENMNVSFDSRANSTLSRIDTFIAAANSMSINGLSGSTESLDDMIQETGAMSAYMADFLANMFVVLDASGEVVDTADTGLEQAQVDISWIFESLEAAAINDSRSLTIDPVLDKIDQDNTVDRDYVESSIDTAMGQIEATTIETDASITDERNQLAGV